jgi:hypothetical protein
MHMPNAVRWILASVVLLFAVVRPLQAQTTQRRFLPELRADASFGDIRLGQVAAGFHVNTGTYVRLAALAGIGGAWNESESGESYRIELQGRFHLDPFRNARLGLYGIGGIAANHDPFTAWQSRLVVGAGVEMPAHGRATWAIEAALAGGFRLSVVTRRLTLGRR